MDLKRLCTTTIGSSASAAYTCPDDTTARIQAATLTNDSGSAVTVKLWLPAGGSASTANQVLKDKSLAAGASYTVRELIGHSLEAGHTIEASAATGGVVSLVVSGIEIAAVSE